MEKARLLRGLVWLPAIGLLLFTAAAVMASWESDAPVATDPPANLTGRFDGMVFAGRLRSIDGSVDLPDTLQFADGHFWSGGCVECSFLPGAYLARDLVGGLEFDGLLKSGARGQFTYRGRLEGNGLRAEISWKRQRWYWTMERDYVFEGKLVSDGVAPDLGSAWRRALGRPKASCPI